MREGKYFHGPIEQIVKIVQVEQAVGVHRNEPERGSLAAGEELPRHEIAVMLHLGEKDDIALAHMGVPPSADNQIDALGCACV